MRVEVEIVGVDCCMEAVGAVERIGAAGRIGGLEGTESLEGMMVVAGTIEVSSLRRREGRERS